jgi:hypothetical protein
VNTSVRRQTSSAEASPPAMRKLTIPPGAFICFAATSWPGCWGSRVQSAALTADDELDDRLRVGAVPVHPHTQRLDAA